MVGAVDLRMTIQAVSPEQVLRWRIVRQTLGAAREARMPGLRVARLAQHGSAQAQHTRVVRPVWIVAIRAVFRDRRMLPQVRPAFFSMTIETGIVQGLANEKRIARLPVRVMATIAGHLALVEWMRVGLHRLRALLLMAIETDRRLACGRANRVVCVVHLVAIGAGYLVVVVRAAVPGEICAAIMTAKAHSVLRQHVGLGIRAESDHVRPLLTTPHAPGVITARAMAGFAL